MSMATFWIKQSIGTEGLPLELAKKYLQPTAAFLPGRGTHGGHRQRKERVKPPWSKSEDLKPGLWAQESLVAQTAFAIMKERQKNQN